MCMMQPPVPPPPAPSGCAALGLRSMSCAAFSLIILYIVLLPLLLLFVRVRTLHARGERLDYRTLLGTHDHLVSGVSCDARSPGMLAWQSYISFFEDAS